MSVRLELWVMCGSESVGDYIETGLPGVCYGPHYIDAGLPGVCYGPQGVTFGVNACSCVFGALDLMPL